jgi:hypothetical protein
LTDFTPNTLHAVATAVAKLASDSVYTTSASSSLACSTILYASLPSLKKRNTYKLVGAERFITSANWVNAARHVFAADSPVQSDNTKMGLGSAVSKTRAPAPATPSPELLEPEPSPKDKEVSFALSSDEFAKNE